MADTTVKAPFYVELAPGRSLTWCACGRSARQPYCDGSHAGTGVTPVRWTAPPGAETQEILLCGCKQTRTPPFCDGSHNALVGVYGTDDPDSPANRAVGPVTFDADGKARLDGGCFVCRTDALRWTRDGAIAWAAAVTSADGARHQSLFVLDLPPGPSPWLAFGDAQVALLFPDASATLEIGTRRFGIVARPGLEAGASVMPGETFRIDNHERRTVRVHAAVGPLRDAPDRPAAPTPDFDDRFPARVAPVDQAQRQAMAERYFQVLVSDVHGAIALTQFIGEIPPSKAIPHRHLYEETLIVLAGEGRMWTETRRAPVAAGDLIFLPRKQLHSLECTGSSPMQLVGAIHPGDNPAINYY